MNIEQIIKTPGATLVDVRTPEEFTDGTVSGAINIPLHTIPDCIEEFKSLPQPVILFCRSGARSFQAATYLKQQGIETSDGGGIARVMELISAK